MGFSGFYGVFLIVAGLCLFAGNLSYQLNKKIENTTGRNISLRRFHYPEGYAKDQDGNSVRSVDFWVSDPEEKKEEAK